MVNNMRMVKITAICSLQITKSVYQKNQGWSKDQLFCLHKGNWEHFKLPTTSYSSPLAANGTVSEPSGIVPALCHQTGPVINPASQGGHGQAANVHSLLNKWWSGYQLLFQTKWLKNWEPKSRSWVFCSIFSHLLNFSVSSCLALMSKSIISCIIVLSYPCFIMIYFVLKLFLILVCIIFLLLFVLNFLMHVHFFLLALSFFMLFSSVCCFILKVTFLLLSRFE